MTPSNSSRLRYEPMSMDKFDLYLRLHQNPNITKYLGMIPDMTEEQYRTRLESRIEYAQNNPGLGIFASYDLMTGEYIGGANINQLDDTDEIQIGYVIDEIHWGKGYATEMANHFLEYGFSKLNLNEICAVCDQEHIASSRVLEKAGMVYRGLRHVYDSDLKYFHITRDSYEVQN